MNRTPSALKWLAEKRARLANDTRQTAELVQELTDRHERLQAQLAALDATIQLYDEAIDPSAIQPVQDCSRYGRRGALREAVLEILSAQAPAWVATTNVEAKVLARFGLGFDTPAQRRGWHKRSLCSTLQELCNQGLAERMHDPSEPSGTMGYWRLKPPETPRLADL